MQDVIKILKQIIITTEHRAVIHGRVSGETYERLMGGDVLEGWNGRIEIHDFRLVIHWSEGGMPALAVRGPIEADTLSEKAPRTFIRAADITGVFDLTDEAQAAWDDR